MANFSAQFGAVGPQGMKKKRNLYSQMVQEQAKQGIATQQVLAQKEQQRYADEEAFKQEQFAETQRQAATEEAQWQKQYDADEARWNQQFQQDKAQWEADQEQKQSQWDADLKFRETQLAQNNNIAQQQMGQQEKQDDWTKYLGIASTVTNLFSNAGGWDWIGGLW